MRFQRASIEMAAIRPVEARGSVHIGRAHEVLEALVVRGAGRGDRVAAAGDHLALGADGLRERVADRLEGLRMTAGEDKYRKVRGGQLIERDLGLPRGTLALEQLDTVEELVGQLLRRPVGGAGATAEEPEELIRRDLLRVREE